MNNISQIQAREILDSRGNPTIEVDVILEDGAIGRASVPSGASTGSREAKEIRDEDQLRFGGKGVLTAINNIHNEISPALKGQSPTDQEQIDSILINLDGTENKSRLGGNAMVGVSVAVARAASHSNNVPLYEYWSNDGIFVLPVPMFNILNGGKHAKNSVDFQEFMIVPDGADSFHEAVRMGAEIYQVLKLILVKQGFTDTLGDEGGFAPTLSTNKEAVELIVNAITEAGYIPGEDCHVAMDVAASELHTTDGFYNLSQEGIRLESEQLIALYEEWILDLPIISIEDGLSENDWTGWKAMNLRLGNRVQLVGDDLYTTDPRTINKGVKQRTSNAVLIKLNQIGTVSETLNAIQTAQQAGWGTVISHRSGDTEDTTIADLAVGTSARQIKAGAPARGERTSKYNRLLRIEEELKDKAIYAGRTVYT